MITADDVPGADLTPEERAWVVRNLEGFTPRVGFYTGDADTAAIMFEIAIRVLSDRAKGRSSGRKPS